MSSNSSEYNSNREDNGPVINKSSQRKTNLYIKNFDHEMNEYKLCKLFARYGTITSCKIPRDEHGRPKNFGFVNFLKPSMAQDAVDNLNGYILENGKELYVNFFQNKKDRQKEQQQTYYKTCEGRNLFIGNLDESIDDRKLKLTFSKYGIIKSAKVMITHGRSKGYGFVCFSAADEAKEAIDGMNGVIFGSKPIYVTLNKSSTTNRESSNYRYPQESIALPNSYSPSKSKSVDMHSEESNTSMLELPTPPNDWIPLTTRIST